MQNDEPGYKCSPLTVALSVSGMPDTRSAAQLIHGVIGTPTVKRYEFVHEGSGENCSCHMNAQRILTRVPYSLRSIYKVFIKEIDTDWLASRIWGRYRSTAMWRLFSSGTKLTAMGMIISVIHLGIVTAAIMMKMPQNVS